MQRQLKRKRPKFIPVAFLRWRREFQATCSATDRRSEAIRVDVSASACSRVASGDRRSMTSPGSNGFSTSSCGIPPGKNSKPSCHPTGSRPAPPLPISSSKSPQHRSERSRISGKNARGVLLTAYIAEDQVPDRPFRRKLRAVKRRPNPISCSTFHGIR